MRIRKLNNLTLVVVILTLAAGLSLSAGVEAFGKRMRWRVTIVDLPAQKVRLLSPAAEGFGSHIPAAYHSNPNFDLRQLKPYSVVLRNEGNIPVVSYAVRWEFLGRNGTQLGGHESIASNSAATSGYVTKDTLEQSPSLAPGQEAFLSLSSITNGLYDPLSVYNEDLARIFAAEIRNLNEQYAQAAHVVVTVTGAMFVDGHIVGAAPETLYTHIAAAVQAKEDALKAIEEQAKTLKSTETVFTELKKKVDAAAEQSAVSADNVYYNRQRLGYEQELVGLYLTLGAERALEEVKRQQLLFRVKPRIE